MRRFIVGVLSWFLIGLSCQAPPPEPAPDEIGERTEILWDRWGVPHIFAPRPEDLFYATGWAQMRSHGNLILRLYGEARGRAAEYWGEQKLALDRWIRTVGIPVRGGEWYETQREPFRSFLDAFTRGMNEYAEQHAEQLDDTLEVVLPLNSADVLAHIQRVIHFEFVTQRQTAEIIQRQLENPRPGSNAWAVGPSRSSSGNSLLLANPHLPWSDFFTWFELHQVSPEVRAYGATLVGLPFVAIGFNENLGWSHTVNTHDGDDHYALRLEDGGYRWEGGVQAFEVRTETLQVKQEDGSSREETLTVKRSVHGPVIAESGDRAVALRVVGLYQSELFEQYWEMARAENLEQFESAVRRLQMPMFTVIYADAEGHIFSLFGGLTPVRPVGDWNWARLVPGHSARTLWTETHPYDDLPRVVDPPTGWVQNANDPPWTTTLPYALDAEAFPRYMAPRFMHFRAQRSARMLQEDDRISFEELIDYKHSTRMELADRIVDDLLEALGKKSDARAAQLAQLLQAWDRQADAESRGAVLFNAFWGEFQRLSRGRNPFEARWSEEFPLSTPDGLLIPDRAVEALESAAAKIEKEYGVLDVPWGEVFRLRRGRFDLPANGGPGELGIFRVLNFATAEEGTQQAVSGDSFVAAVEFSSPVRARVLISYGNSSNPDSPHYGDQLELFSRKELRPAWLTRTEVEQNLELREAF